MLWIAAEMHVSTRLLLLRDFIICLCVYVCICMHTNIKITHHVTYSPTHTHRQMYLDKFYLQGKLKHTGVQGTFKFCVRWIDDAL